MTEKADEEQAEMFERRLTITDPTHLALINRLIGAAMIVDAIEGEACTLTGFRFAATIVEATVAAMRTDVIRLNLAAAAKAGLDIGQSVSMVMEGSDTLVVKNEGSAPPSGVKRP